MNFRQLVSMVCFPVAERVLHRQILQKIHTLLAYYDQPAALRRQQAWEKLCAMVVFAGEYVPYYRELFAKIHFKPIWLKNSPVAYNELPFLDKSIVQEQGKRLYAEGRSPLFYRITGASTGTATTIAYDRDGLDWTSASNILVLGWAGCPLSSSHVHLSTEFNNRTLRERVTEYCKCIVINKTNIFTTTLDAEQMQHFYEEIQKAHPRLIQGHPSTLYALACYLEKSGFKETPLFPVFESTGEKLEPQKRKKIETVLGCQIFDRYGCAEFGVVAHPRNSDDPRLALLEHQVWAENYPISGGLSELVFTGLTNQGMPLLRYRSGDLGNVVTTEEGTFLSALEGRVHDVISLNGKTYPSHYFHDVLTRVGGLSDFQIILNRDNTLQELLVVMNTTDDEDAVRKKVYSLTGVSFPIRFCHDIAEFDRVGWRNKFHYMVHREKIESSQNKRTVSEGRPHICIVCHSMAINGANNHVLELVRLFHIHCDFSILAVSEGPMRSFLQPYVHSVEIYDPESTYDFTGYSMVMGNTLMTTHILPEVLYQRVPVCVVVHESWHPEYLQQHINTFEFGGHVTEACIRQSLNGADQVIFPAHFQADLYKPLLPRAVCIREIGCTRPFDDISAYMQKVSPAEARRKLGLSDTAVVFLQLGTVTHRKNQLGTVRAFLRFVEQHSDIEAILLLVGARRSRGNESAYVDNLLHFINSSPIKAEIHVVDVVPNPYPYLRAADGMVHPSYNEVLPLVLLEAGAFGIPVIGANQDGLPEIVTDGKSGFLLPPDDIQGIADGMARLAQDTELRKRMGKYLRDTVLKTHSIKQFERQYEEVFRHKKD